VGSVIVSAKIRGSRGETVLRALVDTGFYGDLITLPKNIEDLGIELRHKRIQRLPSGEAIEVRYGGGEIEVEGLVTYGDIEVWPDLKLPQGVDALLGVTALEKMGFRVDPKAGKLEKVELYLL
jgi:predicted aspartyl protease